MQDYYKYWKITRPVFSNQNVERDYFVADSHQGIIKRVMFFCQQGSPLLLLTAPNGHGKTSVATWLYDQLPTDTHEVLIVNLLSTPKERDWLFSKVAHFFGTRGDDVTSNAILSLEELIAEEKSLLVIIDNAQHLQTADALDEIAAFMQLQTLSQNRLSLLMLSNEPVKPLLATHAIAQHISFVAELPPLSLDETRAFLQFQLQNQGLAANLFSDDAIFILHEISGGIYRIISTIAENCLMEAFIKEERSIQPSTVVKAASYVVGQAENDLRTKYLPRLPDRPTTHSSPPEIHSQPVREKTDSAVDSPSIKLADLLVDDDAS